jgi:DNA polymerase-1
VRHITYSPSEPWPIALLIKASAFNEGEIERCYIQYLEKHGIPRSECVAVSLPYNDAGKAPTRFIKDQLSNLMLGLSDVGVETIYCADAAYFKVLAGVGKAEPHLGYVMPCKFKGYESMKVVLGVNQKSLMYNPANEPKLNMSLDTLADHYKGQHTELGADIIKYADYPNTPEAIAQWLEALKDAPMLSCDIEGFSLNFDKAGIGTISFAWNKHEGIAFACDYAPYSATFVGPIPQGHFGYYLPNHEVRMLLKNFFEAYQGTLFFHHAPYDCEAIIAQLWMQDLLDTNGLLQGIEIMTRRFNDTKIVSYLATNSTAGNRLGLKDQAHEFAGNWAQAEIKDIRKIPLDALLKYNLVDSLSSFFVWEKNYPIMVKDQQESLYYNLMLPSLKTLMQIEATGMPLNPQRVQEVKQELSSICQEQLKTLYMSPLVQEVEDILTRRAWEKDYNERKAKAKNPDKILPKEWATYPKVRYNPNSGPQTQVLLYEVMKLPVIDFTDTKQPSVSGDTLAKLINHTGNRDHHDILNALIAFAEADKILGTFIKAFEKAIDKGDGIAWLHGSFNLGGTVSGRLSSSNPNLQNLPSGSTYGKLVKSCFQAPSGWIFCGADFNSLEDYISALTTKDPNKLKVYEQGFDGHCLRAAYYFRDLVPHIDLTDPASVNSLKKSHPDLRQDSKGPTFALTYQGTWHTLVNNLGFPKEKAQQIEANYHEMYKVSDEWVQAKLDEAARTGYVTVAFGLRLRTPLLARTLRGHSSTPYEAAAEGRTAGNALGQSYGLLNNRACNEFMEKVWAGPYRYDIKPVALIHDAIYLLIRDDDRVVEWVNRELIKSMQWQELPEIQHDTVKLGAELSLFWSTWADELVLPNGASREEIQQRVREHVTKLNSKKEVA